jgi:hypothetical protein
VAKGGETTWKWTFPPPMPSENRHQSEPRRSDLQQRRSKVGLSAYPEACTDWQQLLSEFELVTRDWTQEELSLTSQLYRTRQVLAKALRVSYLLLDHHQRGKTVYHRNGTVVGNGMVVVSRVAFWGRATDDLAQFEYPLPDGRREWEMRGYEDSLEALTQDVAAQIGSLPSRTQVSIFAIALAL